MSNAELEAVLRAGKGPDPDAMAGFEWRGCNRPLWASLLGIRKFIKGFFVKEGAVEGYNIPVRQNGLEGPWVHKPSAETPKRFGFFTVARVDPASIENLYPEATLLNYGASLRTHWAAPERRLRDYVVQPDAGDPDLMLGKAYLALGPLRVPTNFFILERLRPTGWKP